MGSDIWGLVHFWLFLIAAGLALKWFAQAVYSRVAFIMLGEKRELKRDLKERIRQIAVQMFGHQTLLKERGPGWMHVIMFYGFIILQFGAVDLIGKGLVPNWHLPLGNAYPYFQWFQEMTVLFVLGAVFYAYYRRYIRKVKRLKRGWKAGVVLWFIGSLMLSVLLSEAALTLAEARTVSLFRPASSLIALALHPVSADAAGAMFYVFWWAHLLILLSFLVYVPQSKHAHLLFAPFNIFFRKLEPPGKLSHVDFEDEDAEEFGVGRIEAFARDQLLDLYACVECGRCTAACPASMTGKLLSPMDLIVKMRDHLTEKGSAITSRSPWVPAFAFSGQQHLKTSDETDLKTDSFSLGADASLIGDVITEQELWACTTCRQCEELCPVANEHVDFIIDMRRYLVMTEGNVPAEAQRTLNHIEQQGNPWGLHRRDRSEWMKQIGDSANVKTVQEADSFEYLFYIGSMGSYDRRSQKIIKAMIKIMNHAGISFAVLGNEEGSSGDTARRLGNDYLYQQLAASNIEVFHQYNVRKIITIDPHAWNTFKHEYPELGLNSDIEACHHAELLSKWLQEGRIKPDRSLPQTITYHDSCYLGRYNGIYDAPRNILQHIPELQLVEMKRSRENSMCCGAGGGLMWLEEREGTRINVERSKQALELKPDVVATACPYCLTMMTDGLQAAGADEVEAKDIAELLAEAIGESHAEA